MLEHDLFETVDLFEEKDMNTVLLCIFALGRTIQVRHWTDTSTADHLFRVNA